MADEGDDLLDPEEIEKLLAGDDGPPSPGPSRAAGGQPAPSSAESRNLLPESPIGAGQIEALLRQARGDSPDRLVEKAAAGVAAARRGDLGEGNPEPFRFEEFEPARDTEHRASALDSLRDVELDLRIELGRTELLVEEVLRLKSGSVVPLDKLAGDPVDILVNGRLVARGEVLVLNDNFCVRVAEILAPED